MSADYHPRTLYQAQPGSSLSTNRTPQLTSEGLSARETILDSILQEARNGLSTLCQDYQIPPPPGTVSSTRRTEKEYHDPSDTPHRTIFEYSSTLGISPIANDDAPGKNLHLESNRGGFFEAPPIHHHPPLSNLIHGYTGHVTNDLSRSGSRLASGIGGASPDIAYGRHTHGFTEGVWKRGGPTSAHNTHVNPGNPVWERLYRHGTEKLVSRMSDVEVAEYREQVDLERQRKDLTFRPKICNDMERGGQTWKSGSRTARGADEHRSVDSGVEGTGSNAEGRKSTTAGRGHHMNIAHLARPLRDYSREIEQKNAREMKECTFRPQITPRSARRQQPPFSGRLYEDALARRKRVEELKELAIRREQDKIQDEMANARQSAGRSTFANVPRYAGVWRAPPSNKTRTTSNHRRGSSMTSENYESNSMSRTAGTRSGHQRETTIPVNGINAASKPTTSHQNTLRRSSISTNNNVSMDATSHIRKDIENDPQNKPTIPTVDETSRHGTHILVDEQTQKSDNNMHASFEDMSRMNHSDIWPPRVAVPLIQTSETEAPYDSKNESITSATTPTGTTTFFTFKDEKTDFADSTRLGPVSEQDTDAHTASVPQNNNPSTVAVSTLSVASPQNTTTSPTIRTITPAPPPSSMPMQSVTGRVSREAGESDSDLGTIGPESSVIFDTKFVERATDESTCRSWCEGEDEDVSFRLVGEATVEIANAARPLKNDAVMTDQS